MTWIQPPHKPDPKKISEFEKRYQAVLERARKEYEEIPAGDYYKDGYTIVLLKSSYPLNSNKEDAAAKMTSHIFVAAAHLCE